MDKNEQTTPPDLDVIMKEGLQQFDVSAEPEDAAPATVQDGGPAAADAGTTAGNNATTDVTPFRFKSQDEAEKGYKHIQAENTRITERNKQLTEQIATRELDQQQQAQTEAVSLELEKAAQEMRMKLLDDIDALDPDDPAYRKQVAALQARADIAVARASSMFLPRAVTAPPPSPLPPVTDNSTEVEQLRVYTRDVIAAPEIGLDPADPLFWSFAAQAPATDAQGQDIPLDGQIQWAVEQTKNYHARLFQNDPARVAESASRSASQHALKGMPMGRAASGAPPVSREQKEPLSLSDALDEAINLRRL